MKNYSAKSVFQLVFFQIIVAAKSHAISVISAVKVMAHTGYKRTFTILRLS